MLIDTPHDQLHFASQHGEQWKRKGPMRNPGRQINHIKLHIKLL